MKKHHRSKNKIQLMWGLALLITGIGVLIRIPQVMPQLTQIEQFSAVMGFIRFCFYLMAIILIGGGIKKIIRHFRSSAPAAANHCTDIADN